jgi:large subunit ribosomal protein L18
MDKVNTKNTTGQRQTRTRKKLGAVSQRARLSVLRSNKYMYAQIVDIAGKTVFSMSEKALDAKVTAKLSSMERAKHFGTMFAKIAEEKKVKEVMFDKGKLAYHGRVKSFAEGAREGGLQF